LVEDNGWAHTGLDKTANYLITDDLDSDSSKMSKAKKLNVKIITYADVLEMLKK